VACLPFCQQAAIEAGSIAQSGLELKLKKGVLVGHHHPTDGPGLRPRVQELVQDSLKLATGYPCPGGVEDHGVVGHYQVSHVHPAAGGQVTPDGDVLRPVLVAEPVSRYPLRGSAGSSRSNTNSTSRICGPLTVNRKLSRTRPLGLSWAKSSITTSSADVASIATATSKSSRLLTLQSGGNSMVEMLTAGRGKSE
jgi:hypothetical protein